MLGYLNAPEKTADCMPGYGWLRTGDIARMNEDGYLFITDRLKELIKYKGHQVAVAPPLQPRARSDRGLSRGCTRVPPRWHLRSWRIY